MAITLKCSDCGYSKQAEDATPQTCPECEGTMKKPAYKAKAKSLDEEDERPKAKSKPARDDEGDAPRKKSATKAKAKPLPLDDDEGGEPGRDGRAAESLGISTGFKNKGLMRQVEDELSKGEVLHWAGRMCPEVARRKAKATALIGFLTAGVGTLFAAVFFAVAPWYAGLFPLLFVAVGLAIALFGKGLVLKQAERGWYAVTNKRAIVYSPSLFGSGGRAETYEPEELRRMRVVKSPAVEGAGDLVFKTTKTTHVTHNRGRTSTSTHTHHHGFLGIAHVREVETLVFNVLLDGDDDRPRKKKRRADDDDE